MCELMGLSLNRPAAGHFLIREFGGRDRENVDGWGLAWYPDQSVALIKEPVSWRDSQHTGFLEKYNGLLASIYIAHVRHKTVGGRPTHADTHPFVRELGGREYAFAHNGTLQNPESSFDVKRFRPLGTTDSEYTFCFLLERLARRGDHLTTRASFQWLHRELARINELGQLNCLLSDGRSLFVYHDSAGYKGLVHSAIRTAGHEVRQFEDGQLQLSLESEVRSVGMLFATHPLSDAMANWERLSPGELVVIQDGATVFDRQLRAIKRPSVA